MPPRRRGPSAEGRAAAERIAAALSGLLEDVPPPRGDMVRPDPYRGHEAPPRRPPPPRQLPCPGCNGKLAMNYARGVEIHRCTRCDGLWLDPGRLDQIVEMVDEPAHRPADLPRLRRRMQAVAPPVGDVRYRKCPRCQAVMNRRNFGTHSGVILDECVEHGLFLDPGEFEAIETFIGLGGLQLAKENLEAKLRERQRKREEDEAQWEHTRSRLRRRYWWWLFGL